MFSVGCLLAIYRSWLFDVSLFPRPSILPDDFENENEDEDDLSRIPHPQNPDTTLSPREERAGTTIREAIP
jgi:hypothetical protein